MTNTAPYPAPAARSVLRLSSPADVVAAVPYLVGFQPARSAVLLSLRKPRERVGLTMRVDLPPPEDAADVVTDLLPYLRRDRADKVIVVLYGTASDAAALWATLQHAFHRDRLPIREALRIADGRWWSYLCDNPECCPPDGTEILSPTEPGGPTRVGAEFVSAGLMALGSREELVDTVQPDPPAVAALQELLAPAARDAVRRVVSPGGLAAARRDWQRLVVRVLEARSRQHPAPRLDDALVVDLLIALADIPTRDVAAEWASDRDPSVAGSVKSLWLELTRRAPAPYDVAPATLLAHAAWYAGNGALARVAVERALASDPSYRLALLIEQVLDAGVDPATARRHRPRGRRRGGR